MRYDGFHLLIGHRLLFGFRLDENLMSVNAFNNKEKAFERYQGEDIQMAAMWTCNGCGKSMLENQEGIEKKFDKYLYQTQQPKVE